MSSRERRGYDASKRQEQAIKNRVRILSCAKKLFEKEGFPAVSISQIARESEVSPSTIYGIFKSKIGILRVLMDEALSEEVRTSLVQTADTETDPVKRLSFGAVIARKMYDAEGEQGEWLRASSGIAPELKQLENEREDRRYQRQEKTIRELHEQGSLKKGISLEKARDIFWALTGRDLYRLLVVERQWSSDRYQDYLTELILASLLDPRD